MALVMWADENHDEVFIGPDRYRYVPPTAQTESRGGHLLVEGRPDVKRLTKNEWHAICAALAQVLAGEEIDGYYPDDEIRAAMESAHQKASERL